MGYLLLLLVVPAVWILFMPKRNPRRIAALPLVKPAIVGAMLLLGWVFYSSVTGTGTPSGSALVADADLPIERRINQTANYARGDDQLRAMLQP